MRIRRVGSITCGCVMVGFGLLFFAHMFVPELSLAVIMKLWPVILIALGGEMLLANLGHRGEETLRYDKGAVFITFLMACFACGMGMMEYCMEYYGRV